MKNSYFLVWAIVFITSCLTSAQWVEQYSGNPSILFTTQFLDNNNGYAAGANEAFLKTTDGGSTWIVLDAGSTTDFYADMFFIDSQTGWTVLGGFYPYRHGSILKTTNGGSSWDVQFYINDFLFISIYFIDDQNGWAVGTNGIIFYTVNGGATWDFQYQLETFEWLYDIYFTDPNNGWVVGNIGNKILNTTNGGSSWQWVYTSSFDWLFDIEFIDENIGLAVGDNGRVLKSTDGGSTWTSQVSGSSSLLRDVDFKEYGEAWAVGLNGVILHSTDKGNTWKLDVSGTKKDLFSVSFIDAEQGWVCGNNQLILHRGKNTIDPITVTSPNGGETWIEASQHDITWMSTNVSEVKIELSLNNGLSWSTIVDSTLSTGIFPWTIPNTFSDSCLIKISNHQNPDTFDVSNGIFAIRSQASNSSITVTSPNGGEVWPTGTLQNITWSSESVENVKIELSLTNGASWTTIVDSTGSTGIFPWLVNASQSSIQSRIRISNLLDQNIYDVSDEVFSIQFISDLEEGSNNVPTDFNSYQNYPNPFNPSTSITFDLPINSHVVLRIFNTLGELISELVNREFIAGTHNVFFNASTLNSGVYFYHLNVLGNDGKNFSSIKKMILMK